MKQATVVNGDATGLHTLEIISKADRFNRWMYETIRPFLKGEVLEIGSGIGNISRLLVDDGLTVTLSDFDAAYCLRLKERFSAKPNVREIISIDLQHKQFETTYQSYKGKFDTVFLLNVLEHLEDDKAAIKNCSYLLKKGGTLIILVPAYQLLYCRFDKELGHFRRYTLNKLMALFKTSGFRILNNQYFNFFGLPGWFVFGKLLGRAMIGAGEMNIYNRLVPVFRVADKILFNKVGLSVIVIGQKLTDDF
jgi:2-polyprenyl-3-methyl-5-hydroxy-6-metoxy-1,4-benzoquinol methylase